MKVVAYYPYIGTKLDDEVFKNNNSWEYHLKELLAKDGIDIHTYDKVPVKKADYILFFDNMFYHNLDFIEELYKNHKLDNSVYINYEPISGHAKNHDKKGMENLAKIFNKIVTYDDDLVDGKKFIKGNVANFFGEDIPYKHDFKKRKFLTMITNNTNNESIIDILNNYNCTNYYNSKNVVVDEHAIYSKRREIADYFLAKDPDNFDLYGNLWSTKYNKILRGSVKREDKIRTLGTYKFAVSFDSYTKQNGYISEKIFDCFKAKTIPIYLGADNVFEYIPKDCFINMNDYASLDELYDFLNNMDEETYEKYINNIEKFLSSKKFMNYFSSEAIAKTLKQALLSKSTISYSEASRGIKYFEDKRKLTFVDGIFYCAKTIDEKKKTILVDLVAPYDVKVEIQSNGLKDGRQIVNFKKKEHEYILFDFRDRKLFFKIYNLDKKEYINLVDCKPIYSHEYGLLNKDLDKVIYLDYLGKNAIGKIFYILVHNRRKILKKISRQ